MVWNLSSCRRSVASALAHFSSFRPAVLGAGLLMLFVLAFLFVPLAAVATSIVGSFSPDVATPPLNSLDIAPAVIRDGANLWFRYAGGSGDHPIYRWNGTTMDYQVQQPMAAFDSSHVNTTGPTKYMNVTLSNSLTTYAADTFSRTLTGSWGSANLGGAYSLSGPSTDFGVNGSAATVRSGLGSTHMVLLPDVQARDIDAVFRVATDKLALGGGQAAYLVARRVSAGDDYLARVRFPTDGSVRLQAIKEVAGLATMLGYEVAAPATAHTSNGYVWVRVQVAGASPTTIRMHAWTDGQAEPTAWQSSASDSAAGLQVAGAVGLRAFLSASATNAPVVSSFDDLRVTSIRTPGTVPAFDHVFVVLEENHSYSQIIGSSSAPYINSLVKQNALAANYYGIAHPSLPNYLALTGGSVFGITTDCDPSACPVNAANLADRIEAAGKSWKGYMESMPAACATSSSGEYAVRHNPFVYFNDIRTDATRCSNHVLPYTALAGDLSSKNTTPDFVWITPNLCNDMHDCSISTGDTWLKNNLTTIFNSAAWKTQNSVLFIVWDEDDSSSGNHVPAVVAGPAVLAGHSATKQYTHYSLLRTIESAWGLSPLTTNDGNAIPITEVWR